MPLVFCKVQLQICLINLGYQIALSLIRKVCLHNDTFVSIYYNRRQFFHKKIKKREQMDGIRRFMQSWMGKVVLLLMISPLAVTGIESLFGSKANANEIAKVGDTVITTATYQDMVKQQRQAILQQIKDPSLINEAALRDQVLKNLINKALLENQIKKLGVSISDATITAELAQQKEFLDSNGKFSNEIFAKVLKDNGITKEQLFASKRSEMALSMFINNIVMTGILPVSEITNFLDSQAETRPARIARLDWHNFAPQITVSDAEIQDYYQKNKDTIKSQEMVDLTYLEVDKDKLSLEPATPDEINQQYQAYIKSQQGNIQYDVAMILMDSNAQATMNDIKSQLDNKKADFASLAKQYSLDDGSKNDGGNIGAISKEMFPKDWDNVLTAIKALKPGETTAPIATQYGYQIFKLNKIDGATPPPLESVKAMLTQKANDNKRETVYQDTIKKVNDLAVSGANIQDIASQLHLNAQTLKDYPKTNNQTALNQPTIINNVFDGTVLQDKNVAVGIPVGTKTIWTQSSNYRPMKNLTAEEAVPQIKTLLTQQKATELALAKAKEIANQVMSSGSMQIAGITFQNLGNINRLSSSLSPQELGIAFSQPATDGKLSAVAQATDQGASVIVGGTISQDPKLKFPAEQLPQIIARARENAGESQLEDYLAYLRSTTEVKINEKVLGKDNILN